MALTLGRARTRAAGRHSRFRGPFTLTLRARLLVLFALLGVVPMLLLGVFNYVRSMEALEGLIASRTGAIARAAADEISERWAHRQSDLLLLAENAETQRLYRTHNRGGERAVRPDPLAAADTYLRQAWRVVGASYQWVQFRDARGAALYELGGEGRGADPPGRGEGPDLVQFRQPIRDLETSADLGTLVAAVHLDAVLSREHLENSFGRDGYSVVVDRESGRVLRHPRRALVQQSVSTLLGPEGWAVRPSILAAESGSFRYTEEGSSRIASYASLAAPPWTVISTASVDEFAAPFVRNRDVNVLLVVLITAVVAVGFLLMTRRATRSLEELTLAADDVAAGNLAPRLPASGSDEVGRLSSAFAAMLKEIREMLRRVEESRHMAAVGQFASQLSHEIRNPLTSIKLNLQSLERDASDQRLPAECARPVEICLREVRRLDRVVRGALSLARARPPAREPCSVHGSLKEAVEVLRPQLLEQGITVREDLGAAADAVRGDPEKLKSVFLNLLLNGAEVTPRGGTLHVSTEADGAAIRVRLADEGPGVPPELRQRIFEPFFSTKKEGTGIGLAVALQAVEEHEGRLTLEEDHVGTSGAVFLVELPLDVAERAS